MTPVPSARDVDLTADAPPPDPKWGERVAAATAARDGGRRPGPGNGFRWLFDGGGFERWQVAGAGRFAAVGDRLESVPGDGSGLFWCTLPLPRDFQLRLEWLRWRPEDRSGVLVGIPAPCVGLDGRPVVPACEGGFEVPIDDVGLPGADAINRTAAIHDPRARRRPMPIVRPPAEWNELEITVRGERRAVRLNGGPPRGDPGCGGPSRRATPGYIGLWLWPGSRVAVRRIGIRTL
jgi:hypothetical protein